MKGSSPLSFRAERPTPATLEMESEMIQDKVIMYVHVPKAAGTTLRWVMDRQYPQEVIYKIKSDIVGDQQRLRELDAAEKKKVRVVFGHYCWGLHTALNPGQKFEYVTMLREPVARIISLYAYAKFGTKAHYLWEPTQKMSVVDFVTSGIALVADNAQVRQLCGVDHFTSVDGKQIPGKDMLIPFGKVTRKHLEMAKANLRKCACVGISEEFDSFLACMRQKFGWRVGYYENKNITGKKPQVDDQSLDMIRKYCILDTELYEYARTLALGER